MERAEFITSKYSPTKEISWRDIGCGVYMFLQVCNIVNIEGTNRRSNTWFPTCGWVEKEGTCAFWNYVNAMLSNAIIANYHLLHKSGFAEHVHFCTRESIWREIFHFWLGINLWRHHDTCIYVQSSVWLWWFQMLRAPIDAQRADIWRDYPQRFILHHIVQKMTVQIR